MKTLSFFNATLILLFFIFTGCNLKENHQTEQKPIEQTTQENSESPAPISGTLTDKTADFKQIENKQPDINYNTQDKRMIIRTGTMSIEADKFDETEARIKDLVNKYNGYVTNSTSNLNANGKKQGTITIRVASEKYDAIISELSKIGTVMNQNISGHDVTEEYMDAEARLKTQRELEDRLLKLLSERTAKLADIVDVEQKLAGVRENIERTEGRMKYLRDQASYSTLTISIYEPSLLVTSTGGGFFYEMEQSFKKGLGGLTKVLSGMITVVIALIPVLAVFGLVYFIVRKILRKRKLVKA